MAGSGVRSKYHLAINGMGFMLRGAPMQPQYVKEEVPVSPFLSRNSLYSLNIVGDDLQYSDLAGTNWRYWAQTDWTGGFQRLKWTDDGSFRDGQAIDVISEYGNVKLQKAFTSAVVITGGYRFGAAAVFNSVYNGHLVVGANRPLASLSGSAASKIFKVTSANTKVQVSAMAGISAVNCLESFKKFLVVGMAQSLGTGLKTLSLYTGSSPVMSGLSRTNQTVNALHSVGARLYISEYVDAVSANVLSYTTDLSTFTSAFNGGVIPISKVTDVAGIPHFFLDDTRSVTLYRYDETLSQAFPIYTWQNLTNWGVTKYFATIVITGTSNGLRVAFSYDGAKLTQVFNDQLKDTTYDFSRPFVYLDNLQVRGAQWDRNNWFPGYYGLFSANNPWTGFGVFNNALWSSVYLSGATTSASKLRLGYVSPTTYAISGNVVDSNFGHQIGAVDKLLNAVTMNFKPLATGQTIEMYKSSDEGATYQSVGKAQYAVDGAISNKKLYLSATTVLKTWLWKAQLVGPGSTTPTLQDVAWQYRPVPDLKRRWRISVDAGDEVLLLNKQREQRDGKGMMAQLWVEKQTKHTTTFEDVDAISAKIVSAMTSSNTSARVSQLRNFPPKGRIRVKKNGVVEEMTYTSAAGTKIAGLSRALLSTKAQAYTSADTVDNYYSVVVANISEQINDTDNKRTESIAALVLLEI